MGPDHDTRPTPPDVIVACGLSDSCFKTISQIAKTANWTTQQSQLAIPGHEVSASLARGGKPDDRRSSAHHRFMQDIPRGIYVRVFRFNGPLSPALIP